MNNPMIQLVILGVVALFMVLRLRSVLGTRTGFEPDPNAQTAPTADAQEAQEQDNRDISDHIDLNSESGRALLAMKKVEPDFMLTDFLSGASQAYELILMAYENDDIETLSKFLSKDVFDSFAAVIDERQAKGLKITAEFIGMRDVRLIEAEFDQTTKLAEITVLLSAEMTSEVSDQSGTVIEGDKTTAKTQRNQWTFSRTMGSDDPNWQLVASG